MSHTHTHTVPVRCLRADRPASPTDGEHTDLPNCEHADLSYDE